MLRNVHINDAAPIRDIYNHYIASTPITFEERPVTVDEMRQRIEKVTATLPWLVCEEDGHLLGYAYATKWKERAAYRHSVELTIYLHHSSIRKGKGTELMEGILPELRSCQIHSVLGGVALPNDASTSLLEKFGFRKVAHLSEVGYKFDRWIDVGYWQLQL
jgi:L-amino acid N-acyltransferase YncA